jgi:hypothetical protein
LGWEDPKDDYSAEGTTVMRKRIAGLGIVIAAMGAASGVGPPARPSRRAGHTAAGLDELTRTRIGMIARCTRQGTIVVPWARI